MVAVQHEPLTTIMATLLKRSDAPLYRVYVGDDCATFVQQLTNEHCFDVHAVLHAPNVIPNAHAALHRLGIHMGNSWFQASMEQAALAFVAAVIAPAEPVAIAPVTEAMDAPPIVSPPERNALVEREVDDATTVRDEGEVIWDYVETCTTREATKCAEIRIVLEENVGTERSQRLLARTKATVAQNASGKKNRVLKIGSHYIKLKA